jgi:hypothetical protein
MPNFSVLDRDLFQFLGVISRMNFILYGYQTHIATLSRFKLPCMICAINVTLKLARGKLSFNVNYHTKITTSTSTLFQHGTISQYIKIYYLQKQPEKVIFQ